jgi:hypothetical protein
MGENTKHSATLVVLTKMRGKYALYLKSSVKPNYSPGEKRILTPANALLSITRSYFCTEGKCRQMFDLIRDYL